jgi:tetratricopeptide (TPR) repeat protein
MKTTFLSSFTPSLMSHEALENLFVRRESLAERMLQLIKESSLSSSNHHILLVGPYGIGKTHLISLIYHRVKETDGLRDRLVVAWLREDEWGVTSFLDFLLRILRALPAIDHNAALAERIEALYRLRPAAAEQSAGDLLKELVGDRTLLVLVENMDDLFKGLGEEGQRRLHDFLKRDSFCSVLATAQSLFDAVSHQDSIFYGFFLIHHMNELTADEASRLLTNVAHYGKESELASFLQTPVGRARIRAIHHLAGGNPRVYVIFSQFLDRNSLDELVEPFLRTLDELSPHYHARMAWVSPQQRKMAEFLCERRGAVSVKDIAKHCFVSHQTASGQLKNLREMRYVQSESIGRDSYYELREPMMRLCLDLKKHLGEPIRLVVDFLRLWYSENELARRFQFCSPPPWPSRLEVPSHDSSNTMEGTGGAPLEQSVTGNNAGDCYERGRYLMESGREEEALRSFVHASELSPENGQAWMGRGWALGWLGQYEEALYSFQKASVLDGEYPISVCNCGIALAKLGRSQEALEQFDRLAELAPEHARTWAVRIPLLLHLQHYREALACCDQAIQLGDDSPDLHLSRAECLLALRRWDEGGPALEKALDQYQETYGTAPSDTYSILRHLFRASSDPEWWRSQIQYLLEIFDRRHLLASLGHGLVRNLPDLISPMVSELEAENWASAWRDLASHYPDFELPLELLNTALRYRSRSDPRVLLELPVEYRTLLEPLFRQAKAHQSQAH